MEGGKVYSRYAHYQRKPDGSHFVEFVTKNAVLGKGNSHMGI
jgi:hypothetical protein